MASSSSSTLPPMYDVFLSFRGLDTRDNIVSHLFSALRSKGIHTFKDDRSLEVGASIPDKLIKAIKTSKFFIVVLSKTYADSRWCMDELKEIMELPAVKAGLSNMLVPIFYRVEPGQFKGRNFTPGVPHMTNEESREWKKALNKLANLSGYVSGIWKDEATMIDAVVKIISDWVFTEHARNHVGIVGMRSHMEGLGPLLEMESDDEVRIIGISGMVGVGKTTIAKHLYDQFSRSYSSHCFIDVKRIYWKKDESYLVRYFLSETLGCKLKNIRVGAGSDDIKKRLGLKKVFVVLDDVDRVEQIHVLAKDKSWFGPGSRIIITTRDKGLLDRCGVKAVYPVKCLSTKDAVEMFKQLAFEGRGGIPPPGFDQFLTRITRLAGGLPSAIKIYSSLDWCNEGKADEWEKWLLKYEVSPHNSTVDILRSSYKDLPSTEKIAFLYVACLFNGYHSRRVSNLLDDGESSIKVLVERSLVDISDQGCINMHVLVKPTGREIVVKDSKRIPQKQRILWDPDRITQVLRDEIGTKRIEGLTLNMCEMREVLSIEGSNFRPMPNVKYLKFYKHVDESRSKLQLQPNTASLPHMLKLLHWDAYPLEALPPRFSPYSLVELSLRYSNLKILCNTNLDFLKLKILDVRGSKDLTELPDLSRAMQLEELVVEGCERLQCLRDLPRSLKYLNAHGCNSLETVSLPDQHSINHIDLSDCFQLNQDQQLITHFLNNGQHDKMTSLRFACIPQTAMPGCFNNRSLNGASIQLSPNLMGFSAGIMVTSKRPYHLQFLESSYSCNWGADGEFKMDLKPHLYISPDMEKKEEEAMHYLVIIQVLSSTNNEQARTFISVLELPPRFVSPPVEITVSGVHMNPQE